MISRSELDEVDALWIATDCAGHVAVFTTGGKGPLPDSALASIEAIEQLVIDDLPVISRADLRHSMPRPDDYIAFASRGLFAYDWSDVHRTAAAAIHGYELQAKPSQPITLSQLPEPLHAMATSTVIAGVVFGVSVIPGSKLGT